MVSRNKHFVCDDSFWKHRTPTWVDFLFTFGSIECVKMEWKKKDARRVGAYIDAHVQAEAGVATTSTLVFRALMVLKRTI
jgi:hypothetical protein